MEFIADVYHHTFAIFTGSVELPALDFDFTVLWKDAWCVWEFDLSPICPCTPTHIQMYIDGQI